MRMVFTMTLSACCVSLDFWFLKFLLKLSFAPATPSRIWLLCPCYSAHSPPTPSSLGSAISFASTTSACSNGASTPPDSARICAIHPASIRTCSPLSLLSPLSYAASFTYQGQRERMDRIFSALRPKYALERNLFNRLITLDCTVFSAEDWEKALRAGGYWVPIF